MTQGEPLTDAVSGECDPAQLLHSPPPGGHNDDDCCFFLSFFPLSFSPFNSALFSFNKILTTNLISSDAGTNKRVLAFAFSSWSHTPSPPISIQNLFHVFNLSSISLSLSLSLSRALSLALSLALALSHLIVSCLFLSISAEVTGSL